LNPIDRSVAGQKNPCRRGQIPADWARFPGFRVRKRMGVSRKPVGPRSRAISGFLRLGSNFRFSVRLGKKGPIRTERVERQNGHRNQFPGVRRSRRGEVFCLSIFPLGLSISLKRSSPNRIPNREVNVSEGVAVQIARKTDRTIIRERGNLEQSWKPSIRDWDCRVPADKPGWSPVGGKRGVRASPIMSPGS